MYYYHYYIVKVLQLKYFHGGREWRAVVWSVVYNVCTSSWTVDMFMMVFCCFYLAQVLHYSHLVGLCRGLIIQ